MVRFKISSASCLLITQEAHSGLPLSASFVRETFNPWPKGLPSAPDIISSAWTDCSSEDVTVVTTQTVFQPGSTTTVMETLTSKYGVVMNTTKIVSTSSSSFSFIGTTTVQYSHSTSVASSEPPLSSIIISPPKPIATSKTRTALWRYPFSTFTQITTEYITSTLPVFTVTDTIIEIQPASTLSCSEGCKVDVTATRLVYPSSVIFVPVSITTESLPEPHTPEPLTWVYSGVTLTYPTTYLFYSELSHAFLEYSATAIGTTCPTASDSLTLQSPTNYASLIYPQQETPGPDLPPGALIEYLNGQQTVLVQLSGTPIGSSCDPVGGGIVEPVPATGPAQVVYTSTYVLAQTTSTTETLLASVGSTTTITSTFSPSSTFEATLTTGIISTGTTTVIISSSSISPTTSIVVVTTAGASRLLGSNPIAVEAWILGLSGVFLGTL